MSVLIVDLHACTTRQHFPFMNLKSECGVCTQKREANLYYLLLESLQLHYEIAVKTMHAYISADEWERQLLEKYQKISRTQSRFLHAH